MGVLPRGAGQSGSTVTMPPYEQGANYPENIF